MKCGTRSVKKLWTSTISEKLKRNGCRLDSETMEISLELEVCDSGLVPITLNDTWKSKRRTLRVWWRRLQQLRLNTMSLKSYTQCIATSSSVQSSVQTFGIASLDMYGEKLIRESNFNYDSQVMSSRNIADSFPEWIMNSLQFLNVTQRHRGILHRSVSAVWPKRRRSPLPISL